jgi:dolichol kinase
LDQSPIRETSKSAEVPRKVLHLLVAIVPLIALEAGRQTTLLVVIPLTVVALAADLIRSHSPTFESFIQSVFGFMMRTTESAPGRLVVNGATWVLVSFSLLVLIFPLGIATAAFFLFILADAFAALVGRRVGRHRWPRSHRTVEGTMAFIVVGVLASVPFPGTEMVPCAVAVVLGAAAEIPRRPLNDNLRVPLVIAGVMWAVSLVPLL